MATFFYTETAFHHMGDKAFMFELIDRSAEIGAQGIKFQVLLDYDSFISVKHSMYHEFKKGMFTEAEWVEIFLYTKSKDLEIIFMPICKDSMKLLDNNDFEISYIDIHSVSFYDQEVLAAIKERSYPIILGIGGRNSSEINDKLAYFGEQMKVLMVGFQAFPSNVDDLKLGKISWLKKKYPNLQIGYADHSAWDSEDAIRSNEWAYFLGARYFEKHITSKPGEERWDWQSALSVDGCEKIIHSLEFLDSKVMRYNELDFDQIEDRELVYRNRQKVAVAARNLAAGTVLKASDIQLRMLDSTEGEVDIQSLLSKRTNRDVEKGEKLVHEYLR